MKKYISLFVCIMIVAALLTGCRNYGSSVSAAGKESALTKTALTQPADTTDWKPTTFETLNNFEGVTMSVKEGTVSPSKLTVVFENKSRSKCIYGEPYWLERKIDGAWYQVPVAIESYGFTSIGYILAPEDKSEWTEDWNWLYGNLDAGEYRIVKDILDFRKTGDYDTYYLAAEFSIE